MKVNRQPFDFATFCTEMAARMPCQHGNARPRLKGVKPNRSPYYRYQCPDCGAPLQPTQLKHSIVREFQANGGQIECWNESAEKEYYTIRNEAAIAIKQKHAWDHEGWWRRYTDYLESEKWQTLRAKILKRDNHKCQRCPRTAQHVHHKTYERVGHENESDLESLCVPCQRTKHQRCF